MNAIRFAYITDTHIGCDDSGYNMQPRYLGREADLFSGLASWVETMGISFVVHGGDLTDHGLPQEIDRASELCAMLDVPVHLCLGNHDLMQADSIQHWALADRFLPKNDLDCYTVDAGPVMLTVISHHWLAQEDFRWRAEAEQAPRLDAKQEEKLRSMLTKSRKPVIAVTHAPLNDVPAEQRQSESAFHPPHNPYLATWQSIAKDHPNLCLAMCGHNHAHSQHHHGSFISTTTAAFGEVPAQLRMITVTEDSIEIETLSLAQAINLPADLEDARAWTVGTHQTHRISIPIKRL